MQVCRVSASSFLRFMRRIILNSFSKIYPLCLPIKISDLDKSRMKHGVLLNKNICEKNVSQVRQQKLLICIFLTLNFSHYKSMGTINCHSNESSYPTGIKTQLI